MLKLKVKLRILLPFLLVLHIIGTPLMLILPFYQYSPYLNTPLISILTLSQYSPYHSAPLVTQSSEVVAGDTVTTILTVPVS